MKETERLEKQHGSGWNTNRPSDKLSPEQERFLDFRRAGEPSLRTRYNQEAITQPLRRPSDDEIVPPGRH
jgi:hypothetical protein